MPERILVGSGLVVFGGFSVIFRRWLAARLIPYNRFLVESPAGRVLLRALYVVGPLCWIVIGLSAYLGRLPGALWPAIGARGLTSD